MNLTVVNKEICVGHIRVLAVASSSVFLVGDSKVINCSSAFDTPPESVLVGPLVPLAHTR
ncbi:spore gernimation protein GerPD [Paenibacillus sp. KN14-4R]|uniref:spore gernimation protein GerPD n=1 Tax=Paenibacillus sp. KN14-4R TaxID=3445773 RepID=UPI003F9FF3DD